ncbi:prolyl oligopeptidase family serine peptidase [Opitutus terrae]|uniref:Peptidase S9 prolyl oligopeptidase active site domain protein n=1 Tax=Opitutus terrae (strain DSM 11246 / JCM 15787 / PB90-1) TaxID=452637 RepID=B1ZSG0_OPITP|nr:prolyl oligopeptidase family serine peptidase [Opitutus terrae]ACB73817.1 peptidase S9 prolyl oligopeptidase active site domain protein [Opitutus terrae PB90-1]
MSLLRFLPAFLLAGAAVSIDVAGSAPVAAADDPYRWLEEIDSPQALEWVRDRNDATASRLTARPDYDALYRDALAVLNSASRIPEISAHGGFLYNLWQDEQHPRGIFRRTTLAELRKDEPRWETVLDVDALAKSEGKPWAMGEVFWRRPDEKRCLIQLAPAGGDAVEVREFDLEQLRFVESGFVVPTAKSRVAWAGDDALFVATDFGPGSLTSSGYPRILKRWQRGTPLSAAETLHEAPAESVWVLARRFGSGANAVNIAVEAETFWRAKFFLVEERAGKPALTPLDIPATSNVVDALHGRLIVWLKEDWTAGGQRFRAGSVVIADPTALHGGPGNIDLLVAREKDFEVQSVTAGENDVLVTGLDNVRGRLVRLMAQGGSWTRQPIPFPDNGALKVASVDEGTGDAWVEFESFTQPPTLFYVPAGATAAEQIKAQAPTFDGAQFAVQQLWCTSADGTRVPYFVVGPRDLRFDGSNPVWMFSYGGFENSLTPSYSGSYENLKGAYGKLWLERGGVFVLANIRGGAEFGPEWHTSVLKENHYKCFEDFEAVARDLVTRAITVPARLGIEGRSNGGLLVASTMLRHPELYGAVVCGNPLLDMQRYHRLLAGASWMAEYGNPDLPEEWAFIRRYSPYQNVRRGMKLPPILFYTTTRDDRVHPGHARKMAARMIALGYAVDYYENTEGGHHGSVTSEQLATRVARTFAFLWEKLAAK